MKKDGYGFTIVELLIVIVVIGILAAIGLVAYSGVQNKAHDSIVRQDLANFHKNLELVKVELGRYPIARDEFPPNLKLSYDSYSKTANGINYVTDPEGTTYAFGVTSRSSKKFILNYTGSATAVAYADAASTTNSIGLSWGNPNPRHQGYTTTHGWANDWTLTKH